MIDIDPKNYFVDGTNHEQKLLFKDVIDLGFDFLNGDLRDNKFLNYKDPDFFRNYLKDLVPEDGLSDQELISTLKEVGYFSISQSDQNYLAFPDSGNSVAALLGDIFSKFLNQNMIAFDRSAPIATFIEIQLIEWLRQFIGYEYKSISEYSSLAEVSGMWTSGGHMSNHVAIMTALNHKYPSIKKQGLQALNQKPKIVIAGKITHYSVTAAVHHLGIGSENIINCASKPDFTTDVEDLERILIEHKINDDIFMVVGVAGNTRTSSLDNLRAIAEICQRHNVWFHVDACHGGSLIFSEKIRNRDLAGIELADSISLDPHKGLFVTYPSSFVMFKKRDALVAFTRYEEQVRNGEAWDLGYITPFFGSRGFDSLKIWLLIKHLGSKKLAQIIEERDRHSKFAASLIAESKYFTLFHEMTFYRLVFVYQPEEITTLIKNAIDGLNSEAKAKLRNCVDHYTHLINQELYEEGTLCLDEFKLHDIANATLLDAGDERFYVMSITVGNPLYTEESLKQSLDLLFQKAEKYSNSMRTDVLSILNDETYNIQITKAYGPAGWN